MIPGAILGGDKVERWPYEHEAAVVQPGWWVPGGSSIGSCLELYPHDIATRS